VTLAKTKPRIIKKMRATLLKIYRYYLKRGDAIKNRMIKDVRCLDILSDALHRVGLEPTNICNARCSFCAYRLHNGKKGVMDFELYQSLIDELVLINCREIKFTPIIGDPLCDRNIIDRIEYAASKEHFSLIYLYTNLINLGNYNVDRLINSGINSIAVSTCIADSKMYKRVYGVDAYEKVMRNIKHLFRVNKSNGDPVGVNIFLRNEKPIERALHSPDYKELMELGANIGFMWDDYDNWSGLIKLDDLPKGNIFRSVESKQAPCSQLYSGLIVDYGGRINVCWCRDPDKELEIGKYSDVTLKEAWEGTALMAIRDNWIKGDFPGVCQQCLQYTSVYDHPQLQSIYEALLFKSISKNIS